MTRTLDLNCDMGEGFGSYRLGDDAAMLKLVTSANVACGFHAGDPLVMRETIEGALNHGVAVGAHPSFDDFAGFGRRRILGESAADLTAKLIYQIAACRGMAEAYGHRMTHVKPHGALANMAATDAGLAGACADAVYSVDPSLIFVAMPYSEVARAAEAVGLRVAQEIYADRTYAGDGSLTPRASVGAVIHDADQALDQVREMVLGGYIPTTEGTRLPVEAATLCVHGDTPGAVAMASRLRSALEAAGIRFAPFHERFI